MTAAAAVMIAVFAIFATLSAIEFKQFGVRLAAAVLIGATIIRGVLLPATMTLLDDWNWYLPRSLGWLPKIGIGERPGPEPGAKPTARESIALALAAAQRRAHRAHPDQSAPRPRRGGSSAPLGPDLVGECAELAARRREPAVVELSLRAAQLPCKLRSIRAAARALRPR